jgi:predicted nuclease with TOPRIM domain
LLLSFTVISKESEELRVKLKESQSETRYLKSQLEYLEGELKAMAMA